MFQVLHICALRFNIYFIIILDTDVLQPSLNSICFESVLPLRHVDILTRNKNKMSPISRTMTAAMAGPTMPAAIGNMSEFECPND